MVLLFTHSYDYTVKEVQEWLSFYRVEQIRLNKEHDFLDIKNVKIDSNLDETLIALNNNDIKLQDINSIWFRGGAIIIKNYFSNYISSDNATFNDSMKYYLGAYSLSKKELMVDVLSNYKQLGLNEHGRCNKIISLNLAKKAGLNIPQTLVTTSKEELLHFYKENNPIILKSIDLNFDYSEDNKWFHSYTIELSKDDIEKLPVFFPLTLFQKKIEKKYEIRTFYLNGKCHSNAIFSQLNNKTEVDFRRYDRENMNRGIPYKLPNEIEEKIYNFMKKACLNTGSLDIIRTTDNNFVFLEVNPIGQFGYLSGICNYYLEKQIAEYLKEK